MNASEKDKCKRCGAVIRRESTENLCPACLMSGVLEPPSGKFETVSLASGESLSLYGPSEFPCEFGGYRLLGLLGRGGMGTVYEAEQIATGRRVALKMLGQQLDSPDMRQRFLREGRLAAGINHPNSLYIFGSEEIEGFPVITMEIAGAGTLKDKLKKRGPLPVTEAVDAILEELNRNSYYIYIIHVIVIGGIALAMLNTAIPSLVKYLIATVSTYAVSNLIISFYRKVIKSKILIKRMKYNNAQNSHTMHSIPAQSLC